MQTLEDVRYRIHSWDVLARMPGSDAARALLARCMVVLQQLVAKHRTAVMRVAEFFPRNANLLGLNTNHGERIDVRLRKASNRLELLGFEEVMCTLAHEVAHNFIGPHNAAFFQLHRAMVADCERFIVDGMRLGSGGSGGSGSGGAGSGGRGAVAAPQGRRLGSATDERGGDSARAPQPASAGRRLGGDSDAAMRALRGGPAAMRELIVSSVLRRLCDQEEARCRATQLASTATTPAATLTQCSPSCGTRCDDAAQVVAAEPWPCDLCGRLVAGASSSCAWCCGEAADVDADAGAAPDALPARRARGDGEQTDVIVIDG
jgi:hypothetical protein